jgi:hypothetical protein
MKYFNECTTLDEVKATYKKLAKQHHPDLGGRTDTMQAVNAEYAFICAKIAKEGHMSAEDTDQHMRLSEEYREVLEKLIVLAGIDIEIVGNWLWVTGNTYPVKKQLKEAGLYFASKKLAWYYRSDEHATKGGKKSLDEIRAKYGSEPIISRRNGKVIT